MEESNHIQLNTRGIFEKRRFCVPVYQRPYSWGSNDINKCFVHFDLPSESLESIVEKNSDESRHLGFITMKSKGHFLAEGCVRHNEYELIDGQQRLLTILLFLKVLCEKLEEFDDDETCRQIVNDIKENFIWGKLENGARYHRLLVTEASKPFTKKLFDSTFQAQKEEVKGAVQIEADSRMFHSCAFFEEQLEEMRKKFRLLSKNDEEFSHADIYKKYLKVLKLHVTEKLFFFIFFVENEKSGSLLFDTINNRGLPLNEMDKLKSYLIFLSTSFEVPSLRTKVITVWKALYLKLRVMNLFVKRDNMKLENELLTLYYTTRDNKLKRSSVNERCIFHFIKKELYELETDVISGKKTVVELRTFTEDVILQQLLHTLQIYCELYNPQFTDEELFYQPYREELVELIMRIRYMTEKRNPSDWNFCALIIATFIHAQSLENATLRYKTMILKQVLKTVETYCFRIYFIHTKTKSKSVGVKLIKEAAYGIYSCSGEPGVIVTWLEKIIKKIKEKHGDGSIREFLSSKRRDFTRWKGLRYFFFIFENELRKRFNKKPENFNNMVELLQYQYFRVRYSYQKDCNYEVSYVLPKKWNELSGDDYSVNGFGTPIENRDDNTLAPNYPENLGNLIIREREHDEECSQTFRSKIISQTYSKSSVHMQRPIGTLARWSPQEIERRTLVFIRFCINEWGTNDLLYFRDENMEQEESDEEEDEDVEMEDQGLSMDFTQIGLAPFSNRGNPTHSLVNNFPPVLQPEDQQMSKIIHLHNLNQFMQQQRQFQQLQSQMQSSQIPPQSIGTLTSITPSGMAPPVHISLPNPMNLLPPRPQQVQQREEHPPQPQQQQNEPPQPMLQQRNQDQPEVTGGFEMDDEEESESVLGKRKLEEENHENDSAPKRRKMANTNEE